MSLVQRIILLISLPLLFFFAPVPTYSANNIQSGKVVDIVVDLSPPYIMEQDEQVTGIATQIVKSAFKTQNIYTNIKRVPWSEAKVNVDSEKVLSFWWQITRQREKQWLFSTPVYQAEYVFLARKSVRFYWTRFDQLRPYRIGLSHVQSYGEVFDSYVQYLDTEQTLSDFSAIKKLINKDLDAILIENPWRTI